MTTKNILTNYYFLTNLESNPIPIADVNSFIESDIYKNSKFKDTFYFKEHVIDSHRESWFTQYEIIPITIQGNSINQDLLSLNNWSLISISSKWTPKTIKTAGYNRLWMFNIIDPTNTTNTLKRRTNSINDINALDYPLCKHLNTKNNYPIIWFIDTFKKCIQHNNWHDFYKEHPLEKEMSTF